jgi:RNA polymerase sigma-70 factor (ECF subfamily)
MTDQELAEAWPRMLRGEIDAFDAIYEATRNDVYRTAMFLVNEPHDAADIVSETYIALWKNKLSYDVKRPFRFWLHGIVIKQTQRLRRQRWKQFRLYDKQRRMAVPPISYLDIGGIDVHLQEELQLCVRRLSFKLRVVVILRYFHEYSHENIASVLELPLGTVKSRHHAALAKMRKAMLYSWEGKVEKPYGY